MIETTRRAGVASLLLCLLAACNAPATDTPPTVEMAFRLASQEPCLACEELKRRDIADAPPLHLQRRALLTSDDIEDIRRQTDPVTGQPALVFRFRPSAQARIQQVTTDHVGQMAAWVVNGEVIYAATIASPFSESMQVSGMLPQDQIRLHETLTRTKPGKRLDSGE